MMKKKRTWIIVGIVVLVLAAGGVYFLTRASSTPTGRNQLAANAQTAKVVRTTLTNIIQSTGSINPASKVQLSFGAAGGTVTQVKVVPSDLVKKGDILATVDPTNLQLKVDQAQQSYLIQQLAYSNTIHPDQASVNQAQASYASALASYNAARQAYANSLNTDQCPSLTSAQDALNLAQIAYNNIANDHQAKNYLSADWGPFQGVVTRLTNAQSAYNIALANCNITKASLNDSSLRSAQAQVQSAKAALDNLVSPRTEQQIIAAAQLEQARLALVQAQNNLADATIVAPFDGVITSVNIQVGSNGSSDAIEMADISQLHVNVLVDETEVAGIRAGQKVDITLDALTGITLTGQVAQVDPAGTISQGVVNYNVRVNLDPIPAGTPLLLDMTANANIVLETHAGVLAVPTTAIRTTGSFGGGQGGGGNFAGGGNFGGGQGGNPTGRSGTPAPGGQTNGGNFQRIEGPFVLVVSNGQASPVTVTLGMAETDTGMTEISSNNIHEGDTVIVGTIARPSTGTNAGGGGFPGGGFFRGGGFPGD